MMRYDPSKRPTAADCLQHPYFQIKLPIPLSAKPDEEEAKTGAEEPALRASMENVAQLNGMPRAEAGENVRPTRPERSGRVKVTSRELMQNARYRPGVRPLALVSS